MPAPACSVLILTLDEAVNLPDCLASVTWCDDVQVLDSGSRDDTVALAEAAGATVTHRAFDSYPAQRNFGLHDLAYRHPWVLILDADERVPAALRDEMAAVLAEPAAADIAAFRLRRRDFFLDTWLKHVQASPFYIRLVRPDRCRYTDRIVNEVLVPDGPVVDLAQPFDHFPFNKGIDYWFERHNRYSRMEAEQIRIDRGRGQRFSILKAFIERDFNRRRWHQKELFYRLPCRPWIKFFLLYVVKRGFLDGRAGLLYAQMQAVYERMIVLKSVELQWRDRSQERGDGL